MAYLVIILCLLSAGALQFLTGDFPVAFMAFPLNVIFLVLWMSFVLTMWRNCRKSAFVRFMLSSGATFTAIFLLLLSSFVIGLTGMRWLTLSWPFVFILLYFQTVLFFVILRGWREPTATGARLGSVRWRFIFLHVGLLLAVASPFWGNPDSESIRLQAWKGQEVNEGITEEGRTEWLSYEVELMDFTLSYGPDGMPSDFAAVVFVDGEEVTLKVNHPYGRTFCEDLYLVSYDNQAGDKSEYCILEIVKEPWKYGAVTGIIMMLVGALMLFVCGPKRSGRREE